MNELIKLDDIVPVEVFTKTGIQPLLDAIKEKTIEFVPDMTTEEGRTEIKRMARKVVTSKTFLDGKALELTQGWRDKTATVNESKKISKAFLDELRDEILAPLTVWENENRERIKLYAGHLTYFRDLLKESFETGCGIQGAIDNITKEQATVNSIELNSQWREFLVAGTELKEKCLLYLDECLTQYKKELVIEQAKAMEEELERKEKLEAREKEIAEEAKLKAEIEAQKKADEEAIRVKNEKIIAEQKVIQDKKDAEEKALAEQKRIQNEKDQIEQEKIDAIKREEVLKTKIAQDEKDAIEKAKSDEAERERVAKVAEENKAKAVEEERLAEIARTEAIKKLEVEAEEKRLADIKYVESINNNIATDISTNTDIGFELAHELISAITQSKIRNVQINY